MQELNKKLKQFRVFDETEAYLRHRARVHEREKREKLRKEGKLEAYLAEIEEAKKRDEESKSDVNKESSVSVEKIMEEYSAIKKIDKENSVHGNLIRLENTPEEDVSSHIQNGCVKKKKKKKTKKKKKVVQEEKNIVPEEDKNIVLEEAEFKPEMAGSTGLPTFYFTNLVEQNRSIFARYRVTCRQKKKN